MTMRKNILGATAAVFIAVMMLLPTVAAQEQPKVSVDNSATKSDLPLIQPEIGSAPLTLGFLYQIPNQYQPLGGAASSVASASIDVGCTDANNVLITGPNTVSFTVNPQEGNEFEYTGKYTVAVTRDLPGLKKISCNYSSSVAEVQNPSLPPSTTATGTFTVTADFFSLVQAKVASQIKEAGPQKEVPFEIQLDNFGNARTQIQFEINERPGGDKWSAVVPDDVILDSPASGGGKTSDTAIFTIQTPFKNGWNNEQGTYRLKLVTFAADDPDRKGQDIFTNVLIRVRGVYVPSLEPMVMVGAVIGAAFVARMVRDD